eukprot:2948654-Prymnesium_polylepis.1
MTAQVPYFNITQIAPAAATIGGDSVVTLRGVGLDQLAQVRYRSSSRFESRDFLTQSSVLATATLPCPRLGLGVFTLSVTLLSFGNQAFNAHGDASEGNTDPYDVRFLCSADPRFDGYRPFVGPSWPGNTVRLTTSLHNAERCAGYSATQKHLCNPPPFNILEQSNLFAASQLERWPSTIETARCRWVCLSTLGCTDSEMDVYGRVTAVDILTIVRPTARIQQPRTTSTALASHRPLLSRQQTPAHGSPASLVVQDCEVPTALRDRTGR